MTLAFFVAGRITNPLNGSHRHWSVRAKWAKSWRGNTCWIAKSKMREGGIYLMDAQPKRIKFLGNVVRLFDDDNFRAAMKPLRDGLQDAGVIHHDGPRCGHVFEYKQRVKRNDLGVTVVVEDL